MHGPEPQPDPQIVKEVRDLYLRWIGLWNDRNAAGMEELVSEHACMVGFDGSQMNGRDAIVGTLKAVFTHHMTARFISIIREVRPLSPDVALLRAVAGMVPRGGNDINPNVNAVQSLVAVRSGGQWSVALFQNTPAAFHGRPDVAAALSAELREALRTQPPVEGGGE